jgi:E3 ubiquitin-protein ligase SHPRH
MEEKEKGILLECNHIFCENCLKEWLTKSKKTCPTCRKEVVI